jgi:hypothetical protein
VLVVSRVDASELLDTIEEALDEVLLSIAPTCEGEALLAIGAVADVRLAVHFCFRRANGVAIIAFVAEEGRAFGHSSIEASASHAS